MNKLKLTILSLSVVTVMAGAAVAPALGVIAEYFNGEDPLLIKFIITLPSLFIILTSFGFSALANKLSSRAIAVIGLILYIVGGSLAGFAGNIYLLLLCRALLGIGVGLLMPLSTGLLAYYFDRSEQAKLMGYSVAMNNIGGVVGSVLSGYLVSLHWRLTFGIYLIGLVVLVLVLCFLPKTELRKESGGISRQTLQTIAPYALAMFVVMIAFYTVPSSFAIIVSIEALVPTASVGLLIAVQNVTAFLAGVSLSFLVRKFRSFTPYFGTGVLALSFFFLGFSSSLLMTLLGLITLGIGMGTVVPILNAQIALHVEKQQVSSAMAVISAMLFLGQFLSPVVITGLQAALHMESVHAPYTLAMVISLLLCIAMIRIPITLSHSEQS